MKKIIGIFASIVMMLSLVGVSAVQASALSQVQINAIIGLIQSFGADASVVANVTASLNGQPTSGTVSSTVNNSENSGNVVSTCINLNNYLSYGSRDAGTNGEVTVLQDFLQSNGYLSVNSTGFYGLMTVSAVKKFQAANGISQAGFVGVGTRAKIKSLSCNGATTTVVPSTATNPTSQTPTTSTISAPIISSLGSTQGKVGDLITISGSNTVNGATISFQRNNVIVTTQNINYIPTYFIVPNITPGDYTVYLNQNCQTGGCSTSNYVNFTITSPTSVVTQTPSITIINPQTGGSVWNGGVGSVENIQWIEQNGNYPVTISLLNQSDQVVKTIIQGASNTGSYIWAYDSTILNGKYRLKMDMDIVFSGKGSSASAYTGYFSITNVPATTVTTPAPIITSFYASPSSITSGQQTTLYWASTNTTSCYFLFPSRYNLNGVNGSYSITPENEMTSYNPTLYCEGPNGTVSRSISVPIAPIAQTGNISISLDSSLSSGNVTPTTNVLLNRYIFTNSGSTQAKITNISLHTENGLDNRNVSLYVNGAVVANSTVTPNGDVVFNSSLGLFTIPANTSVYPEIKIDLSNLANGYVGDLRLESVASNIPVSANLPMVGVKMTIVSTAAPTIISLSPTSGTPGTQVTINGSGFVGLNKIVWTGPGADASLTPTSISANSITFMVPSNSTPGSFDVGILEQYATLGNNGIGSNSVSFTVTAPPVSNSCSSVTINGTSYTLNPCSINVTMVHGSGNKNFSTTIVPSTGGNYGFSVYGSPTGFPSYGLMNNISSGGASGNQNLTFYFNDAYLPIGTYTGYVRIGAWTQNGATDEQDLNLNVNLTVTQ